jgi:hypothetical protein
LKSASLLHFQEEASGLDLNRRMMVLSQRRHCDDPLQGQDIELERTGGDADGSKNHGTMNGEGKNSRKRQRNVEGDASDDSPNNLLPISPKQENRTAVAHPIQKFRYIADDGPHQGYRELLATFAHVAAAVEDDPVKLKRVQAACDSGGDFVGDYYFQYEVNMNPLLIVLGWSS